jgi:hypothetical protein
MELKVFLTYVGLLITAYNVNEEYRKIKIELSLRRWQVIFFITLFLLFISSNLWLKDKLIEELNIQTYFYNFIWVSKYYLIVAFNLYSLYKIFTATKLNKKNSKVFFKLIKNLETQKKYDIKNRLIKENLENIFKYKNYYSLLFRIKNKLYYVINPYNNYKKRIDKGLEQASKSQKDYLDKGGDFSQLNTIGNLPDTKYTKIENFRKSISEYIKPKPFQNYFSEIYEFILDKKFIKQIIKNDEQFALEILVYIAKYKYFTESYEYREYFLKKTLSNKKSLTFNLFYEDNNDISFVKENQQFENGFDLGLIICETIEQFIIQNQKDLQKKYLGNSEDSIYKHIYNLYQILEKLDTNKMHLAGTPYYIQEELIKLIDFSKKSDEQNLAFKLLLTQLDSMKDLALKSQNDDFIEKNINQLLKDIFEIKEIDNHMILEIAFVYSDYIFDKFIKDVAIETRIKNFKEFINNNNNQYVISTYLKVFNNTRSNYNGKDYISYTKSNQKSEEYWKEINTFLASKIGECNEKKSNTIQ